MDSSSECILLCRAGYEGDAAAQIQKVAANAGVYGFCKTQADSGYLRFITHNPQALAAWFAHLSLNELIFARQICLAEQTLTDLPAKNRLGPILCALDGRAFSQVRVETPDAEATRPLMRLARQFTKPLEQAMRQREQLQPGNTSLPVLHLTFISSTSVIIGTSQPGQTTNWTMGIPRLKLRRDAPSRSALKLEEAMLTFLSHQQRQEMLRSGLEAVDLGAAPGGWTWQLLQYGLMVTAVDNGPLAEYLTQHPAIEHRREDGFSFRPERPVAWLVCDMVEKPTRVAQLMAQWLADGDAQRAMFNLKLPMKRRQQAVEACINLIDEHLTGQSLDYQLSMRQLYHDRDEITAYLRWDWGY